MCATVICMVALLDASSQAVRHKNLLVSFGAGAGQLNLFSDRKDLADLSVPTGALRFSVGYALSGKWSLGIHYDRIGSTYRGKGVERSHMTTYLIDGCYRPWVGAKAALECHLGLGPTLASMTPTGGRLPYTASGSAIAVGVRYLHLLSGTVGAFAALDHAYSSSNALNLNGGLVNPDASVSRIQWNSQRITLGLLARF